MACSCEASFHYPGCRAVEGLMRTLHTRILTVLFKLFFKLLEFEKSLKEVWSLVYPYPYPYPWASA